MTAPCYIFEGTWWNHREVPKILPYFEALSSSHGPLDLSHRTIRTAEDVRFWIKKIPKNSKAFVYFACHGQNGNLVPTDNKHIIKRDKILEALSYAKYGAIEFVHFGCCEFIIGNRRKNLDLILSSCNAKWASGYAIEVDWLQSTFLEMALVAELYLPFFNDAKKQNPKLKSRAHNFFRSYEQLARTLNFSGLSRNLAGISSLIPQKQSNK